MVRTTAPRLAGQVADRAQRGRRPVDRPQEGGRLGVADEDPVEGGGLVRRLGRSGAVAHHVDQEGADLVQGQHQVDGPGGDGGGRHRLPLGHDRPPGGLDRPGPGGAVAPGAGQHDRHRPRRRGSRPGTRGGCRPAGPGAAWTGTTDTVPSGSTTIPLAGGHSSTSPAARASGPRRPTPRAAGCGGGGSTPGPGPGRTGAGAPPPAPGSRAAGCAGRWPGRRRHRPTPPPRPRRTPALPPSAPYSVAG